MKSLHFVVKTSYIVTDRSVESELLKRHINLDLYCRDPKSARISVFEFVNKIPRNKLHTELN